MNFSTRTSRTRRSSSSILNPSFHLLETLEPRALLAAATWDGGGNDGLFSNPLNWAGDVLPANGDDITINAPGNPGITYSTAAGTRTFNSFTTNQAFTLASGSLTVTNSFNFNGGSFTYAGGTLGGTPELNATAFSLTQGASPVTFILKGASSFSGNVRAGQTLWVRGGNDAGNADVTLTGNVTNIGTIRLESIDQGWASRFLNAGSFTVTNNLNATINANAGTGGERSIAAPLTNRGNINVQPNALLLLNGNFTQISGSTSAQTNMSGTGEFRVVGNAFTFNGGTFTGNVTAFNSAISVANTVNNPSTFFAAGTAVSLVDAASSAVTIQVRGSNALGNADLQIPTNASNSGILRLQSIDQGWTSRITIAPAATLTNTGSGRIESNLGTGGDRSITGSLVNQGSIQVATDASLTITGTYNAAGGNITGPGIITNSSVSITAQAAPTTAPSVLTLVGANTLTSDIQRGYVAYVRGGNLGGNADLTVTGSITNRGTIRLQSIDQAWRSRVILGAGNALANATNGTIEANIGTGGDRTIDGPLNNSGNISIFGSTILVVTGDVTQTAGSINVGSPENPFGEFRATGPNFTYNGGSLFGFVRAVNSAISVASSVTSTSTLFAAGTSVSLLGNASFSTTIAVRGSNDVGNTDLNINTAGIVNTGRIVLESADLAWRSRIVMAAGATLTNTGSGQIVSNLGSGGERSITGNLTNQGLIDVAANASLIITGSYNAAGGAITGPGVLAGTSLSITAQAAPGSAPSLITLIGNANTLTTDVQTGYLLHVRGGNFAGHADLAISSNITNRGTIKLESADQAWRSSLSLSTGVTLTNTGTINANLGSGGERAITGNLVNDGDIDIHAGVTLVVAGDSVLAAGGNLTTHISSPSFFGRLTAIANSSIAIDGSLTVILENTFSPDCFAQFTFITAAVVSGSFTTTNFPTTGDNDKYILISTPTSVTLVSTALADFNNDGTLNSDDLSDYITAYFNIPADPATDFNNDGIVNSDDLSDFITAYFNGC